MHKSYSKLIAMAVLSVLSLLVFRYSININTSGKLNVNYLDVGQGDSALITMPTGERILIDTGNDIGVLSKLSNYIPFYDNTIDFVILTHPDIDHVGMFKRISQEFKLKNIIISSELNFSQVVNELNPNIRIYYMKANSRILTGINNGNIVEVFNYSINDASLDENSNSIVTIINYQDYNFTFTADITSDVERSMISQDIIVPKTNTTVKVAHHGSKTSSSELMLKKIKPKNCIISAGKNNNYGHPNQEVKARLEKYCENIYNTINDGDISFQVKNKKINIKTQK
jgi:competence protein ComEC